MLSLIATSLMVNLVAAAAGSSRAGDTFATPPTQMIAAPAPRPGARARPTGNYPAGPAPQFDVLLGVGAAAVALMLLCYTHEGRFPNYALGTAAACLVAAIYGFLQGAWPLGIASTLWAFAAFRRWRRSRAHGGARRRRRHAAASNGDLDLAIESRLSRMFGPPRFGN